jgi:hypothetical protein
METDPNLGILTIALMLFAALAAQFGDANDEKREEEKKKKDKDKLI